MVTKKNPLLECSLISLRAFGEAAKMKSFTYAAASMSVTQSAISHHIKLLEEQLQVKLFERHGRTLELTSEGRELHKAVQESFTLLSDAIGRIRTGEFRPRIILGVLASFASKWLVPRLGGFYKQFPEVELVVRSVNHTINVERESVNFAVVTLPAPPSSANISSALLWHEQLFPVCSPAYAGKLKSIEDLRQCTLLHDETEIAEERGFDWSSWLRHFKMDALMSDTSSQYFSQSDLTLQAAISGHGVALTRTSIASNDIKNGLLVNPFPRHPIATHTACYLCSVKSSWNKPAYISLRDWLLAEAAADNALGAVTGAARKTARQARKAFH